LVLEEGKEPKDLQMYSGGETVRIVFSIVLSLAKLLSLRAGKKHEALIIDEKIAKLDARGILQFGEVIREISKIYKQVFVITHIESLKDLINGNEIIVNKTEEGSLVTVE
jgi:DNA repair exonuclease SbcCD ATPase subunit